LVQAIQKLLTPKKNIDILKEAITAKKKGQVYSIAFIGVNGVGKSTSLAKTAYYLKSKGNLKVMLAGCDNFRSGAIEQLETHAKCLGVPLYQKGYKDDPAIIAKEAI
jgi:signal recognition particle receptor subunit alpha